MLIQLRMKSDLNFALPGGVQFASSCEKARDPWVNSASGISSWVCVQIHRQCVFCPHPQPPNPGPHLPLYLRGRGWSRGLEEPRLGGQLRVCSLPSGNIWGRDSHCHVQVSNDNPQRPNLRAIGGPATWLRRGKMPEEEAGTLGRASGKRWCLSWVPEDLPPSPFFLSPSELAQK